MNVVRIPDGFTLERLHRSHPRDQFHCGVREVDDWLASKALQQQDKHLSVTTVLVHSSETVAGYYTLASGQVDFSELPIASTKRLPRRRLPVAVLAWLGVRREHQGQGLGKVLVAQALHDCFHAGKTFAFVAVVLDCINDAAKEFYRHWDFEEFPGQPYRLFLTAKRLALMMESS